MSAPDAGTTSNGLATSSEVEQALLGLQGIFWALHLLVVHRAVDDMVTDEHRDEGIEKLIVAGHVLADEIAGRI